MPASTIATIAQTIAVSEVEDVIVTPAVLDPDTGDYVREIRVSGQPVTNGNPVPVFTLRLTASAKASLDVVAPEQPF